MGQMLKCKYLFLRSWEYTETSQTKYVCFFIHVYDAIIMLLCWFVTSVYLKMYAEVQERSIIYLKRSQDFAWKTVHWLYCEINGTTGVPYEQVDSAIQKNKTLWVKIPKAVHKIDFDINHHDVKGFPFWFGPAEVKHLDRSFPCCKSLVLGYVACCTS